MKKTACERARETWLLAGDGGVSARRRRALQRHVDACSDCRSWTADARRWMAVQQAATPDWPLSEGTRAALRVAATRLHGRSVAWGTARPFSLPALAAAMLVFAGLSGWMLLRPSPPPSARGVQRPAAQPGRPNHAAAAEMGALAYLLQADGLDAEPDGWLNGPSDGDGLEALVQWILRVQAGETLAYLDDRLAAVF